MLFTSKRLFFYLFVASTDSESFTDQNVEGGGVKRQ